MLSDNIRILYNGMLHFFENNQKVKYRGIPNDCNYCISDVRCTILALVWWMHYEEAQAMLLQPATYTQVLMCLSNIYIYLNIYMDILRGDRVFQTYYFFSIQQRRWLTPGPSKNVYHPQRGLSCNFRCVVCGWYSENINIWLWLPWSYKLAL